MVDQVRAEPRITGLLFGLRVVMLGRQGSGKGTQGEQLARMLVVPHVSVGDVLRDARRRQGRTLREVSSVARVSLGSVAVARSRVRTAR